MFELQLYLQAGARLYSSRAIVKEVTDDLGSYNLKLRNLLHADIKEDALACGVVKELLDKPITKHMLQIYPLIIITLKYITKMKSAPLSQEMASKVLKKWRCYFN